MRGGAYFFVPAIKALHFLAKDAPRSMPEEEHSGYEGGLKARIANYADDFVMLSVNKGQEACEAMKHMVRKLLGI